MKRLSAIDALARGAANVRANPQLVAVSVAGSVALLVLVLLSFLPWLGAIGFDASWLTGAGPDPAKLRALADRFGSLDDLVARLGGFLLAVSLALTLASIVYCWYQGGILGVLVAGDAQAPAGGGRDALLFRTFSLPFFVHEAQRLTWRLLLFYSLFFAVFLAVIVLAAALLAAAGLAGGERGVAAGCALACGLLLPLLFVGFALLAAIQLGQAELVRPESGVLAATRAAFATLGRRLGAAALLVVLFLLVSFVVGIGFGVVNFVADLALSGRPAALVALHVGFWLVQVAVSAVFNLVFTAAFVALARSEAAAPEPA